MEEAKQRKKDPTSFSRIICCGKCLVGPKDKNGNIYVANIVNILMIALNITMVSYTLLWSYVWLTSINIGIGVIAQVLMWCVQCSDPGIINRNQDEDKLSYFVEQRKIMRESGDLIVDFNDSLLSLNEFEMQAVNVDVSLYYFLQFVTICLTLFIYLQLEEESLMPNDKS